MTTEKGLYVLALRLKAERTIQVGKLGAFAFPAGLYLYVGSAWGPGGLKARVTRHLGRVGDESQPPQWHLDYLLPYVELEGVVTLPGQKDECALAEKLASTPGATRFPVGFGAADCRCPGHLILLPRGEEAELPLELGEEAG